MELKKKQVMERYNKNELPYAVNIVDILPEEQSNKMNTIPKEANLEKVNPYTEQLNTEQRFAYSKDVLLKILNGANFRIDDTLINEKEVQK